jgi:hypothetical protein
MNKVVMQGRREAIELDNLPLPNDLTVAGSYEEFDRNWDAAMRARKGKEPPSLKSVLLKTYGRSLFAAGIFKLIWSFCVIM